MTTTLTESWARIELWLAANAPEIRESLNPPATADELEQLTTVIGQDLPADLIASYQIHNGQAEDAACGGLMPFGEDYGDIAHSLASLEEVIMDYEMMTELLEGGDFVGIEKEPHDAIKAAPWNKGWIPIANDGGGDYHCVDLDPGPQGIHGQIITVVEGPTQAVIADSLAEWLEKVANEMEANALALTDEDYQGLVRWAK
jgi:cell wall assembly regulator SMI1